MPSPPAAPNVQARAGPSTETRNAPEPREPRTTGPTSVTARNISTDLEDYQCPVCMDTFINVFETDCGHRFCRHCLGRWFYQRRSAVCPSCRSDVNTASQLPEVNARLERYIARRFTDVQKAERETLKRSRETFDNFLKSHIIRELEPVSDNDSDVEPQPLFMGNGHGIGDFGVRRRAVILNASYVTVPVPVGAVEQTPNSRNLGHRARTPSRREPLPRTRRESIPPLIGVRIPEQQQQPVNFEDFENRLNGFERRLLDSQAAYNLLMDFQLENDGGGTLVRRMYDRFNALGLVEESQRHQWPYPSQSPPERRHARRNRFRNGDLPRRRRRLSVHYAGEEGQSFNIAATSQRSSLDATGWLAYFHRNRHNGGTPSDVVYNGWETFMNSNLPLDTSRAGTFSSAATNAASNPLPSGRDRRQHFTRSTGRLADSNSHTEDLVIEVGHTCGCNRNVEADHEDATDSTAVSNKGYDIQDYCVGAAGCLTVLAMSVMAWRMS